MGNYLSTTNSNKAGSVERAPANPSAEDRVTASNASAAERSSTSKKHRLTPEADDTSRCKGSKTGPGSDNMPSPGSLMQAVLTENASGIVASATQGRNPVVATLDGLASHLVPAVDSYVFAHHRIPNGRALAFITHRLDTEYHAYAPRPMLIAADVADARNDHAAQAGLFVARLRDGESDEATRLVLCHRGDRRRLDAPGV